MRNFRAFLIRLHDKLSKCRLKKIFRYLILCLVVLFVFANIIIYISSGKYIHSKIDKVPQSYTALIPGASVYASGEPSPILADRLDKGLELYKSGKIKRFLLSGDHGTRTYDEVNGMKKYLEKKGVPDSVLFTDHAGFDTYSSMVRARDVFEVDSVIIVTQKFHLHRALYIARKKGLEAYGYSSDMRKYSSINYLKIRETFANVKAFFEVLFNVSPKFGGEKIPIRGDSSKSFD
ncbi:MAG: ElyC/SanA/YdcF family protein [Bacteroidales bacterium]|jgi:SanA protein|nr:YdcF family protein [Bacteroidales bacterium]